MRFDFFVFDQVHLLGESATHPMALRLPRHTALLTLQAAPKPEACLLRPAPTVRRDCRSARRSLAGSSPPRCRALSGTGGHWAERSSFTIPSKKDLGCG